MPRVNWKGTGSRHIEVPGVGPRGLVVLEPGVNTVTDAELSAMQVAAKVDLDAGTIVILQDSSPVPGMVDSEPETPAVEEEQAAPAAAYGETPPAPEVEPAPEETPAEAEPEESA